MKYRLYIDEVGNSDMGASNNPNHRYLSLTGVIIDLDHVKNIIHPEMENLKQRFFKSHPDDPLVFHRRELVRRERPFHLLNDPTIREAFDTALLEHLRKWDYWVISVSIDKLEHQNRYTVWKYHPYHYCLHVLLERYILFLERQGQQGDVISEARGGEEDRKLKESFTRTYEQGTSQIEALRFQKVLTSKELKLKQKSNNIAGLQLADLLAHPSHKSILSSHHNQAKPEDFSGQVIQILMDLKYFRSSAGKIEGWGRKWLP